MAPIQVNIGYKDKFIPRPHAPFLDAELLAKETMGDIYSLARACHEINRCAANTPVLEVLRQSHSHDRTDPSAQPDRHNIGENVVASSLM